MGNFFKSLFTGKEINQEEEELKKAKKNFEVLKYDGLRASRMGRTDYAETCFHKALEIQKDFETMDYLSQLYIQTGNLEKARETLEEMITIEPSVIRVFLTLTHVCFMQEAYSEMREYALKAIEIEKENATALYQLAKAEKGLHDELGAIANLTKALLQKEDFTEALLLRAEILLDMHQYEEAQKDIKAILTHASDDENALILQGKLYSAINKDTEAEETYRKITSLNPFNEQAYLALGKLYIAKKELASAISLLDEAIEINPNFDAAYHERGRAKLLNGDKDGSIEDMKIAMELNSKQGESINGQFDNQNEKFDNLLGFVH